MRNFFTLDGKCSKDFGVYISGSGTYNAPERDVETLEIPGRHGTLVVDNHRFHNVELTYPAFIRSNFPGSAEVVRAWLCADPGYRRLEDTYHPDQYRMARFPGEINFETKILNKSAEFDLIFDCKPQRYLKTGEAKISTNKEFSVFNPTLFEALPLIRVYGINGTLEVGNIAVQVKKIDTYVDIDSETQNAFKGTVNCNQDIYAPDFPVLPAGRTGIRFSGNIERIEIRPRWWTI